MSLQLTRLRVAELRQFRQPFELSGLTAGLNIFSGPNEAGKSTLVRAIRAAFFERYRSKVVEDLRPRGDAGAMPSVEIDFKLNDETGQLQKSFLGPRARCSLHLGSQQWDGNDAEDHLASLLGFAYAGKGASKAEHWGIPGLLWVEQGTGQELAEAASFARNHIHTALQERISHASAGALAATGGDELLAKFQGERDTLLSGTGKPRLAYQEAIAKVEQLGQDLTRINADIATYQQQVDHLARLRAQHLQDEQERPWEPLRQQLAVAQQTAQAMEHVVRQLAEASATLGRMTGQRDLLVQQIQSHDRLKARLIEGRGHAEKAAQSLVQASESVALSLKHADGKKAAAELARKSYAQAMQESTRSTLQGQAQLANEACDRHQRTLLEAVASQGQLDDLLAQSAKCVLTEPDVKKLRKLERTWQDRLLERKAASTRLEFSLHAGQTMALRGLNGTEQIEGQGERLLSERISVNLPGLGELTITPGGQDLAELGKNCEKARLDLEQRLQALGLTDVAQADELLAQQKVLLIHIEHARKALEQVAPEGLEPLKQALAQAQGQMQTSEAALSKLPPTPVGPVLPLDKAELQQRAAERMEEQARSALGTAQNDEARAEADHQARVRELQLLEKEASDVDRTTRHEQAGQQLAQLAQDLTMQAAVVQQCTTARDEARPDIVQQDIDRLSRSISQMERAHSERNTEIQVLDHALQKAGGAGLDELRQAAAGDHSRADQRMQELKRRAQALALLCSKLQSRRQAALAQLRAPLQQHLERYLKLLFPQATVAVGEQLTPDALVRRTTTGAEDVGSFASLSFGAREQLGLISRFAYADLLQEAGRPTLLILDDALVHSDGERLAQMKRVLFDAAQRHQVLLFTCHPEDWRDMGESIRAIVHG